MKSDKIDLCITQLVRAAKHHDLDALNNAERAYLRAKEELIYTVRTMKAQTCSKSS